MNNVKNSYHFKNFSVYLLAYIEWVINSVVECLPYKQKVTGSNPVLPTLVWFGPIV